MLKYIHVTNDLGSGAEIRYFYEPFTIIDADCQDQRAGGSDYRQPFYLVDRGEVFKILFKNRSKAGEKAKEKKCLINNRNTAIILFLTKGIVLLK